VSPLQAVAGRGEVQAGCASCLKISARKRFLLSFPLRLTLSRERGQDLPEGWVPVPDDGGVQQALLSQRQVTAELPDVVLGLVEVRAVAHKPHRGERLREGFTAP
jgi:hypothetical protein